MDIQNYYSGYRSGRHVKKGIFRPLLIGKSKAGPCYWRRYAGAVLAGSEEACDRFHGAGRQRTGSGGAVRCQRQQRHPLGAALAGRRPCAPARDGRRPSLPVAGAWHAGAAAGCPAARRDPARDPQRTRGLVRDHRGAEYSAPVFGCPQTDAQKKTLHAAEQDRPDVAQARRVFIRRQPALDPNRLVFIDETWAATNMTRRYGRCARGLRLRASVPHGHWKLTTLVAGLRTAGITAVTDQVDT